MLLNHCSSVTVLSIYNQCSYMCASLCGDHLTLFPIVGVQECLIFKISHIVAAHCGAVD